MGAGVAFSENTDTSMVLCKIQNEGSLVTQKTTPRSGWGRTQKAGRLCPSSRPSQTRRH